MQRQVPQVQAARKTVEALGSQFIGRVLEALVILQIDQATKHVEIPPIQYIDEARQYPSINQVTKHVEFPQSQHIDKVVEVPAATQ